MESKLRDLTIKLTITMPSPIVSIQCPSHPGEIQIAHEDLSSHATSFFHSTASCSLSKDFILLVEQQRCFDPRVLCELDVVNNTAAVSLAFIPPPVDMLSASQIQCELILLIDCSGSMKGPSIACVRECMQLLLHSLPVHSYFNIITFGSKWFSLFSSSQAYDDTSLSAASQFVSMLKANLGGTEIYPSLLHVLTSNILPMHPRQVFLLTDGQVSNVEQLVRLTSQHAVSTRLFTFGIGDAVDRMLCKKLAQAGRGKCEFVTAEDGGGAGMREKVVRQVARAMQPVLTDVKVDWRQLKGPLHESNNANRVAMSASASSAPSASFLQCPSIAPAVFMSSRYVLHALNVSLPDFVWQQAKGGQKVEFSCEITMIAHSNHPHEKGAMHYSVVLMGEQITQASVIHTLAAKERIRELEYQVASCSGEEKKRLEDEILQLAIKHTLSSIRTSFVVVHNAGTDKEIFEEMAPVCKTKEEVQLNSVPRPRCFLKSWALQESLVSTSLNKGMGVDQKLGRRSVVPHTFKNYRRRALQSADVLQGTALGSSEVEECHKERTGLSVPQASWKDPKATPFEDLIQLQSAKGIWEITPMLINVVHAILPSSISKITMQSLQAISKEEGVEDAIVGVIVALLLLETHYMHKHVEWEMLATKALFFLNEDCKVSAKVQQDIKGTVAKLLGN